MKKTIFSFAITAVAAVAMVSCGNKTDNTAGGEATAEGEQATEQVADATQAAPSEIVGPVTIETKTFTVDLPEGWYVMSPKGKTLDELKERRDLHIAMKEPLKPGKPNTYYSLFIQSFDKNPTEQQYIDTYVKNHNGSAAADAITIDGKQAQHFAKVTELKPDDIKEEHCITVALPDHGFVGINSYGIELGNEDVQKVLTSMKLK